MSETHRLRPVNLGVAAESEVVRDERHKGFFWQDNEIVRVYGPKIGPNCLAVYSCLAFHADNSRRVRIAYPSYQTIAREIGSSKSTVKRAMAILVEWNIVALVRRKSGGGDDDSSLKVLLPKEEWKPIPLNPEDAPEITQDMSDEEILEAVRRGKGGVILTPPVPNSAVSKVKKEAGVGSKHGLDLGHKQEPLTKNDLNQKSSTTAGNAVVEDSSESFETPSAAGQVSSTTNIKQQLLEFATARSIPLSDLDADMLIDNWPAARLPDSELVGALTLDGACYGLDDSIPEKEAAKLAQHDANRLRWFLCVWGAFKESTDAYHEKTGRKWSKTQCFLKRWKTDQPPATWLEAEIASVHEKARRDELETQQREVEQFWATLSNKQQAKMNNDALEDLQAKKPAEYFNLRSPEVRAHRWHMLRDEETRNWLLGVEKEEDPETVESEGEIVDLEYDDSDPAPPVQMRFEALIGAILQDLNSGKINRVALDKARPSLLEDEEWTEVKRAVTLRLAA